MKITQEILKKHLNYDPDFSVSVHGEKAKDKAISWRNDYFNSIKNQEGYTDRHGN